MRPFYAKGTRRTTPTPPSWGSAVHVSISLPFERVPVQVERFASPGSQTKFAVNGSPTSYSAPSAGVVIATCGGSPQGPRGSLVSHGEGVAGPLSSAPLPGPSPPGPLSWPHQLQVVKFERRPPPDERVHRTITYRLSGGPPAGRPPAPRGGPCRCCAGASPLLTDPAPGPSCRCAPVGELKSFDRDIHVALDDQVAALDNRLEHRTPCAARVMLRESVRFAE